MPDANPCELSIMVLPTGAADALPQFLLEHRGIWRDMSPPPLARALVSVAEQRMRLDSLLTEMARQMRTNTRPSWVQFGANLRLHYRALMPERLHQMLQQVADAAAAAGETPLLRIHQHPATEWIPWEILHDGEQFLGLRFRICRLPIAATGPDLDLGGVRRVARVFNLLGENVFDQPAADNLGNKWKETFAGLLPVGQAETRFPAENGAAVFPSVDNFLEAATAGDILHITCHGDFSQDDNQLFWTLNRFSRQTFTYHITAAILGDLNLMQAPLVFGNACFSSLAGDVEYGLAPGFGSIFFAQGALAFIGAFASITQTMAVRFARRFYERLLSAGDQPGPAVAQALLDTKLSFKQEDDPDPSYLYYTLYGPAETRFAVG